MKQDNTPPLFPPQFIIAVTSWKIYLKNLQILHFLSVAYPKVIDVQTATSERIFRYFWCPKEAKSRITEWYL